MKKLFLISTFLLATIAPNIFGMGMNPINDDLWALGDGLDPLPEEDFGKESFCDFLFKQEGAQELTFKEIIERIEQCLGTKIYCDTNLENIVLPVPTHVINVFNNSKTLIQTETNKMKQEIYKGTLLVLIKELFSKAGYALIHDGNNTFRMEKSKLLTKNK